MLVRLIGMCLSWTLMGNENFTRGKRTRAKDGETRGSSPLFRPRDLGRSGLTSVNARSSNVSSVGKGPLNLADVSSYLVIVIMLSRVITHNGGYRS